MEDPECIGLRLKLAARDKRAVQQFEDLDGVLYKVARADEITGAGVELMRPALPKKLRPIALHNAHNSIYGGHNGVTSTLKSRTSERYVS